VVSAIEGVPLVLGFSAASESESSYADNFSSELGVWMCDRFTSNLMHIYERSPYKNLFDIYKELNTMTLGSHVQVYNSEMFYNLKDCMLWDYFNYLH
jgi:glycosylphosphatidylinositol transamidase (GPIT) subunit GPI8